MQEAPLSEIVEFRRGLTYKKSDEVEHSRNAVLRANNIDRDSGTLDLSNIRYIDPNISIPDSKKVEPESLLICTTSGSKSHLGKVAYIGDETGYAFGGFMGLLVPAAGVSAKYLYYFTRSQNYWNFIDALSPGANINNLRFADLGRVTVPLPPLDEQKRIVAVLDQTFAALDRARAHAEVNLVDAVELRNRSVEHELSSDALGRPESIGPHVELLTGFAFKSNGYSDNPKDIRLVRGDNIVQGAFRWDGVKRWPLDDHAIYERYELALNDVLVAMDRTWVSAGIKYAIVDEAALPSLLVQRVARLRAKASILPRYVGYWIGSKLFEEYVLSIQTGLGVPHVSGKQIESFPVRVPPVTTQAAIVERLDAIVERCNDLISAYKQQLLDLAHLRQSLLQKAFSGDLL